MHTRRSTLIAWMLVFALGWAPAAPVAADTRFFAPFRAYETGSAPQAVAVGDFNGDGRPDLAVATRGSSRVSILLGKLDGTFGLRAEFDAGPGAVSVAAADLNGDGRLDLALARDVLHTTITVLLGNGNGTFGSPVDLGSNDGGRATVVAIADLDRDGRLDLAATSRFTNGFSRVVTFIGTGDGTFGAMAQVAMVAFGSILSVADLNADGAPDIVLGTSGAGTTIGILLGNGDGTFHFGAGYSSVTSSPVCMSVGDLNGDGRADVAVGTAHGGVAVHLGNGDGTLGPRQHIFTPDIPTSVAMGELTGDGLVDLALANGRTGTLSVLAGNGDGSFDGPVEFATGGNPSSNPPPYDPAFVAVADLNRLGAMDLVAVNSTSNTVSVHLGNGDGTFGVSKAFDSGPNPGFAVAGDFDGDGNQDLAASHSNTTLSVHLGLGDGAFAPRIEIPTEHVPTRLVSGDIDQDGLGDLISVNQDSSLSLRLGIGGGLFGPPADYATRPTCTSITLADIDNDAIADVVLTCGHALSTPASLPFVSVFRGLGDGTLGTRLDIAAPRYPTSVAVGNMNEDQVPDLVVVRDLDSISVLLGNGDGTYQPGVDFPGLPYHGRGALADVNEDGHVDVVLVGGRFDYNRHDRVGVLPGNGDGSLGGLVEYPGAEDAAGSYVADLDQDGHADLALPGGMTNTVSVMYGRGDGSFGPRDDYGTGRGPYSLAIGDWNGDGHLDLATADYLSSRISILENVTAVLDVQPQAAVGSLRLGSIYPNPTRGDATIAFEVAKAGTGTLRLYDLAGRMVRVLMEGPLAAGRHVATWDGRTAQGWAVPSGIYFYELRQSGERLTKRLMLVR